MLIHVYQTTGYRYPIHAASRLVAEVEVDQWPEDAQDFADEHGGDIIEVAPGERRRP